MPLTVYPINLPGPRKWEFEPFDRRRVRGIREPSDAARAHSRDRNIMAQGEWLYIPDHMTDWIDWYNNTLKYGLLWFSAVLPGEGGFIPRVVRYAGPVTRNYVAIGVYIVSAPVEVRGFSLAPQA